MMKKLRQNLLLAAAVALVGCSTAGVEGRKAGSNEQVRYRNAWLKEAIEMKDLKVRKVGDILQANATVFSNSSGDLSIQYRFAWYDKDGFEIDKDAGSWKLLTLHGRETVDVAGVAPNMRAEEFKIVIREKK